MFSARRPQLLQFPFRSLHVVQFVAFKNCQSVIGVLQGGNPQCITYQRRNEVMLAQQVLSVEYYLYKCHPGEFIITLHRVSEVVLQSPKLPVQVVVDWNGAES